MSWHYRIFKIITKHKYQIYTRYSVREYYVGGSWTIKDAAPVGDTKEELIQELEMMLRDIKKYRIKIIQEDA